MRRLCEYGCGQEAKFQLKNGKGCCSKSSNSCPTNRLKMSKIKTGHACPTKGKNFFKKINCPFCSKKIAYNCITRHSRTCKSNPENIKKINKQKNNLDKICEVCKKIHNGLHGTGRFCSHHCSHVAAASNRIRKTKKANCKRCGKLVTVNIRVSLSKVYCEECKKIRSRICKWCGEEKCLRRDVCRTCRIFPLLIEKFGFDESKIGTIEIYEEFDRITNLLIEDYFDNELVPGQIDEKYKLGYAEKNANLHYFLKSMGVFKNRKKRNFSEAGHVSFKHGISCPTINHKYQHQWHTTWNGHRVFLRSSYELNFAKKLDEQKIEYEVEKLRIVYWDSQKNKQRVAIPDFYLPKENKIIEIKSSWTYDKQNMDDKVKAYKEHGYSNIEVRVDLDMEL